MCVKIAKHFNSSMREEFTIPCVVKYGTSYALLERKTTLERN
jgi:hypothetical protein